MNNKKGVKLLAAVMAFAMVLVAGFVVIGFSDDSSAAAVKPGSESDGLPTTADLPSGGSLPVANATYSYKVNSDKTFTVPGKAENAVTIDLYLVSGNTVTIIGAAGATGVNANVTVNIIPSDGTKYFANESDAVVDSRISISAMTSGEIKVKVVSFGTYEGSVGTASAMELSGTSSSGTVTIDQGNIKVPTGNTFTSSSAIETGSPGVDLTCGIKYTQASGIKNTYYADGMDAGAIELTGDSTSHDIVTIFNGKTIVSQGDNMVTIDNSGNTDKDNAVTVTHVHDRFPTIAGAFTALADSTVTFNSGFFADASFTTTNAAVNGVVMKESTSTKHYTNQIPASLSVTGMFNFTSLNYYVDGNVTQKVSSTSDSTAKAVQFADDAVLVVSEGVTLKVGAITKDTAASSVIRIFGTFDAASNSVSDAVQSLTTVGPTGCYKIAGVITTPTANQKNTNVTTGSDTLISGTVTSSTLGSCILSNTLTIPAGMTVTLEGDLGLNGQTLNVNGTLVINKGSSIFGAGTESIVLGKDGKIENNGSIGVVYASKIADVNNASNYITINAVSGAEFGYKSVTVSGSTTYHLYVTGDIQAMKNTLAAPKVAVKGTAVVAGEVTIGKGVELNADGSAADIYKGSVVTVNGKLTGAYGFKLGELSEIIINGTLGKNVPIVVSIGTYSATDNSYTEGTASNLPKIMSINDETVSGNTITHDSISGIAIYNKRVADPSSTTNPYVLKAYINGTIIDGDKTNTYAPVVNISQGQFNVASGEEIIVSKGVGFTTGVTLNVSGKVTVMDETTTLTNYKGAHYQVTATVGGDTVGYYLPVADAMAAIETADDKTVNIDIATLSKDVTVKAGQTITVSITTISKDATLTVEDDATMTGSIGTVDGMVIIAGDANSSVIPTTYASKKVGTDGSKTYAGFAVAVENAVAGDVITIGKADVGDTTDRESLIIPAGVKVVVTDKLTINGNLTIPETAELVGGTISVVGESPSKLATVNVAGKLDLSSGMLSGSNNTVTSSGEVITQSLGSNMNGAYYVNNSGKYVLTNVTNALTFAKANGVDVRITGTYTDMTDLTVDGANITIDDGAKVTLGKVTLVEKKITATGDLTATITAKSGSDETTGAVSDAVLEVVKSSAVIESKKTTSAAGVNTYTLQIDKIDGEMKVAQGTVTTSAVISSIATGSKFIVASGATFAVVNNVTVNGDNVEFVVDGTMTVKGATVTFDDSASDKAPVINGTLDIQKNGIVNASSLVVLGDVNVVNTETETGSFTIASSDVKIGAPMETLGSGASVTGPMSIASPNYLIVFAGADMSKALINVTAGVSAVKSTEFYVNDVLYATVYSNGSANVIWTSTTAYAIENYNVITPAMLNEIVGVDDFGYTATNHLIWKDVDGNAVAGKKVGEVSALYTKMTVSSADVIISVGEGISLYVDGVRISVSGDDVPISVGEHTVKAIVDPGYKGETAITFNGASVTNGKIVITADMVGATDKPVLSVTGDIAIDNGSTSGSSSSNDGGMGITDYLLIVLVILAAILVVVVAIRMMRS